MSERENEGRGDAQNDTTPMPLIKPRRAGSVRFVGKFLHVGLGVGRDGRKGLTLRQTDAKTGQLVESQMW